MESVAQKWTRTYSGADEDVIAALSEAVAEIAAKPVQGKKRDLWRAHNSLKDVGLPVYIRAIAARETINPHLQCTDPLLRSFEAQLRRFVLQDWLEDDYIIEPWLTMQAVHRLPADGGWGVPTGRAHQNAESGAFDIDPPIKELDDANRLIEPAHRIDESATAERYDRVAPLLRGLELAVSRKPWWTNWHGDVSTDLAYLRGVEQMMWDMMDYPEWLHSLLAFMRDGVLKTHREAEEAGHWRLVDHENQSMPYAEELEDPRPESPPVRRQDLWLFIASQETGTVSPEMFDEFMLEYQIPIAKHFGLVAYGCCEDLTRKIDLLRKIPNLRRIAVTPFADVPRCAEQIGSDYVCSYRPSPAEMVAYGYDDALVRRTLRDAHGAFRANGCRYDVCLKDVETVEGDPTRLKRFVQAVREESA